MQADELYKFSDGTLKSVREILNVRLHNFMLGYNADMPKRAWIDKDQTRTDEMLKLIDNLLLERRIISFKVDLDLMNLVSQLESDSISAFDYFSDREAEQTAPFQSSTIEVRKVDRNACNSPCEMKKSLLRALDGTGGLLHAVTGFMTSSLHTP
ncbi:hypothetical protein Tco_1070348 [Tanacetum coccineum]|uniref:Uncharacterized protein n=1 Tax=Tanacetum coccineum TaxID=301880 RepID=A0ABQ5HMJ0_9ASTR